MPLAAWAQAPRGLTLREVLRLAEAGNPELAAASLATEAAAGRRQQAAALPNPTLGLDVQNAVGSGRFRTARAAETTLQLSQLVELGGKRELRVAAAQSGQQTTIFDFEVRRYEVLVEVAQAFVQTLGAQVKVQLAEENRSLAAEFVGATKGRLEAGAGSPSEEARARLAAASAEIEVQQARRDLAIARQRLAAPLGTNAARVGAVRGDLLNLPAGQSLQNLLARLAVSPAIVRFKAETAQREATLALARATAVPDLTLAAGPRFLQESHDTTLVLGVSLPLPLWNRNEGAIREARAELARTGKLRDAAWSRLNAKLGEAWQTYDAARLEIDTLNRLVLPAAQDAFRLVNEGYAAGRGTQLEVIDARRGLTAGRLQLLNAQAALHSAVAQLEGLTAGPRFRPREIVRPSK